MIKNHSLEKNIVRLYNCYVLSQNQNGGNDELSFIIKKRLDKKIVELKNLEGGTFNEETIKIKLVELILQQLANTDIQQKVNNEIINLNNEIKMNNHQFPFIIQNNIIIKHIIIYIIFNEKLNILDIFKEIFNNNNQVGGVPKTGTEHFIEFLTLNTCPFIDYNIENDFKNLLLRKIFEILSVINLQDIIINLFENPLKTFGQIWEQPGRMFNNIKEDFGELKEILLKIKIL